MGLKKIIVCFFLINCIHANAQTIPLGSDALEDAVRRSQVTGSVIDNRSFAVRPLQEDTISDTSVQLAGFPISSSRKFTFLGQKGFIKFLSTDWLQQYNSKTSYGWNDGTMIPAKGYQTLLTSGLYLRWGVLSIQLKPELVWAQNASFKTFSTKFSDTVWAGYYINILSGIDAPETFGTGTYKKLFPGQSSVSINVGKMSFGLSTENLWWGPGIRNSLIMSNSAPGFLHLTLHTSKPIHTAIGSFEGQIIGGKLIGSNIPDSFRTINNTLFYSQKPDDWRYLSAMIVTWQPKWIKGLYLGFERSIYEYSENLNANTGGHGITKYLPVLQGLFGNGHSGGNDFQDQLSSLFFRWVLTKSNAEFYFEWARNDRSQFLRDLLLEPEHSRAFTVGGQKFFALHKPNTFIQVLAELTQLQEPNTYLLRPEPTFYVHFQVINGYTNQGQYVGAGIGPGSNSQTFDISYVSPKMKLGVKFERLIHNNDFYYRVLANEGFTHPWIDMASMLHGNYKYQNYLFFAELGVVNSPYYEWGTLSNSNTVIKNPILNIHGKIGISLNL